MKAVVLEVRGREAVLLLGDGTVRRVRGHYEVGQTVDYRARAGGAALRWAASIAASAVLLGASAGLWAQRNLVAYAEVSLDVNPSIVYTLNRRDRVLSVRAANEDAEAIVAALSTEVRFEPLAEAVTQTLELLEDGGYLDADQDDYVLVNVSADDEARQTSLTGQAEAALERTRKTDPSLEYRIDHSDRATAKAADDQGVSVGRYAAWQAEQESDDAPELTDFADCPVKRILRGPEDAPEKSPEDGQAAPGRDDVPIIQPATDAADVPREDDASVAQTLTDVPRRDDAPVTQPPADAPREDDAPVAQPQADAVSKGDAPIAQPATDMENANRRDEAPIDQPPTDAAGANRRGGDAPIAQPPADMGRRDP